MKNKKTKMKEKATKSTKIAPQQIIAKKIQSTKTTVPPTKISTQFKHFQDLLSAKREDILKMAKNKEVDLSYGEIGDEGDMASQTFEREMMFEMTNGERMVLDDIEAALRRIEKNEYGVCESCRTAIPIPRLNAMPWTRYCITCQTKTESPG